MLPLSSLDDVERLYADRGHLNYGEGVSQIEHALQCAELARSEGARPSLTLAALLHDVGHLFGEDTALRDGHAVRGARALATLFGDAVCAPIALHVEAKRYLCSREPGYFDRLSAASKASLAVQGGPFDTAQAAAFEQRPCWKDAVTLRRYDDHGKREGSANRTLADLAGLMRELARTLA